MYKANLKPPTYMYLLRVIWLQMRNKYTCCWLMRLTLCCVLNGLHEHQMTVIILVLGCVYM